MSLTLNVDLVLDLAHKMKDPSALKQFMVETSQINQDSSGSSRMFWDDLSLAGGYPSLVLLFSILQRTGFIKENIAHQYILKMKESIESRGVFTLSLFNGISGICFALQQAFLEDKRYSNMLYSLHDLLIKNIKPIYIDPLEEAWKKNQPISSQIYDVIQGLSGIGRYLLEDLSFPHFLETATDICKALVRLCQPLYVNKYWVPGWLLSPKDPLNARNKKDLRGNFNLGLAHGVPGILAFFAIASLRGIVIDGQKEAMFRIATWIREKSHLENGAIRWPYSISWEKEISGELSTETCRDAWCYGVPGVARSLFLAGKAMQDEKLKSFALQAFGGIFFRTREEWLIPGPMLCHGVAGLLMTTIEMAKEEGCVDLLPRVCELREILISYYHPEFPFGFKDKELNSHGNYFERDNPGFLEGSTGAALALLSASDLKTDWALPLMIYG